MIDLISEPSEKVMYKKQHERTDSEAKILKELENKYHFKTNDELDQFLVFAGEMLNVSPKEAYRKLIHFLG